MKTIVTTKIKSETERIRFGYWDSDREEWIELEMGADLMEASEKLQCSTQLLDALVQTMDIMRENICEDLCAIWQRLDEQM